MKSTPFKSSSALFLLVSFLLFSTHSFSATVSGTVKNQKTAAPVLGALIGVENTTVFAISDIEGNFTLDIAETGNLVLTIDADTFDKFTTNLVLESTSTIKLSAILVPKDQSKKEGAGRLASMSVSAAVKSGSESALLSMQKRSPVVQDSIGSEQIAKSPDSDAGDAAKRVTGITMVGDYVFIRGMGERYASVMLADSIIASPDPDKRVIPLSIFPVGLLDNITIIKTFNPDMPGEFSTGVIKIDPRDFPDKRFFELSLGTGVDFNTYGNDYLSYQGGKYDFLGYDDGTRAFPSELSNTYLGLGQYGFNEAGMSNFVKDQKKFSTIFSPEKKKSFLPHSLSFSFGDKKDLKNEGKVGYLVSGRYSGSVKNDHFENKSLASDGSWSKSYEVDRSRRKVSLGGLASFSFIPKPAHKVRLLAFYTHDAVDETSIELGTTTVIQPNLYKKFTLNYKNDDLLFTQITGSHLIKPLGNSIFKWTGFYSYALHQEPDKRATRLIGNNGTNGDFVLSSANDMKRTFLKHSETVYGVDGSIQTPFKQWSDLSSKIYIGGGYYKKFRDSESREFYYLQGKSSGLGKTDLLENGDDLETIFDKDNLRGFPKYKDEIELRETINSSYTGLLDLINGYIRLDLPIMSRLQLSGGVRYENAGMEVSKYEPATDEIYSQRSNILRRHTFYPGINLTLSPHAKMNIRSSYSKTVARPEFQEANDIRYIQNDGDKEVYGNTNLVQCDVHSVDLRYEIYPSESEIVSFSVFYKHLLHPIEMLQLVPPAADQQMFKYKNGETAFNVGAEFEIRKDFGFIHSKLADLYLLGNFTYVFSQIEVIDAPAAVYSQKERPLQGQSPYIINLVLGYQNERTGLSATCLFNTVGPRIKLVAIAPRPNMKIKDVYEQPSPSLDFVVKKNIGKKGAIKASFKNILDLDAKDTQGEEVLRSYKKGREISLNYSLKL